MIHFPRQTKLTLDVTLKRGREQISRKVTVNYPKKLYPFELKQEITAVVTGFKTMASVLQKVEKARRRIRPYRTTKSRAPFRRRRVGNRPIAISTTSKLRR